VVIEILNERTGVAQTGTYASLPSTSYNKKTLGISLGK
jgi:hypothetical protein